VCFGAADPVLGPGAAAVTLLEVGELTVTCSGWRVGREAGDAVPVGVGEPQLRTGWRPFLAHNDPHPGRPARRVEQIGDLGQPGAVADAASSGMEPVTTPRSGRRRSTGPLRYRITYGRGSTATS
jgi:hypothetical protein